MNKFHDQLRDYLEGVRVIDTHEHLPGFEQLRSRETDLLAEYTSQYFRYDLASAGLSDQDYLLLQDSSLPILDRWKVVEPYWELCRLTGYGRHLDATVQALYSIDRIDSSTIEELDARFKRQLCREGYTKELLDRYHIETCLLDTGDYLIDCDPECFTGVCRVDTFISPQSWEDIRRIESASGIRICSFGDWKEACSILLDRAVREGAKAFKLGLAYRRSLCFERAPLHEAEASFDPVFASKRYPDWNPKYFMFGEAAQDHMLHHIMGLANRRGLVFQIHTGLQAGNSNEVRNADPRLLTNLFCEYPDLSFDLFHIGYPYQGYTAVLAKTFPNVYIDMCWAHIIAPEASRRFLKELIDIVPVNKVMAFGGDVSRIDLVAGHLQIAKENIASALSEMVSKGRLDISQAEFIAERIFYRNPSELFSIGNG